MDPRIKSPNNFNNSLALMDLRFKSPNSFNNSLALMDPRFKSPTNFNSTLAMADPRFQSPHNPSNSLAGADPLFAGISDITVDENYTTAMEMTCVSEQEVSPGQVRILQRQLAAAQMTIEKKEGLLSELSSKIKTMEEKGEETEV